MRIDQLLRFPSVERDAGASTDLDPPITLSLEVTRKVAAALDGRALEVDPGSRSEDLGDRRRLRLGSRGPGRSHRQRQKRRSDGEDEKSNAHDGAFPLQLGSSPEERDQRTACPGLRPREGGPDVLDKQLQEDAALWGEIVASEKLTLQ